MSTLSVSAIKNTGSPQTNIVLGTDGSVTIALPSLGTAPTPVQTGTLWYDIGGVSGTTGVVVWDGAAWQGVGGGGGSGTVTAVSGSAPIVVATGTTTPAISITAATTAAPGSVQLADAAASQAGTSATLVSTPAFTVSKDAATMTGAALLPSGTTGQQPGTLVEGMTRVNTDTRTAEIYTNSSWRAVQSTSSGQFAGFRNILINGNFAINQRGYVSGTATTGANQYTLDRWKVLVSGQNLAFAASGNGNQITAPAGGVQQVIENINVGGGTYTLSWTGTATAQVNGSAVVNGGQVTLPANTQATVTFSGGTVSQAQLEPGFAATPFEQRGFTIENSLCLRYFIQQNLKCSGINSQVTKSVFTFNYAPMRVIPTLTFISGTVLYGSLLSGSQSVISMDGPLISNTSFASGCNIGAAALVVNEASLLDVTFSLSAEL